MLPLVGELGEAETWTPCESVPLGFNKAGCWGQESDSRG
jgi:hypothetical protein